MARQRLLAEGGDALIGLEGGFAPPVIVADKEALCVAGAVHVPLQAAGKWLELVQRLPGKSEFLLRSLPACLQRISIAAVYRVLDPLEAAELLFDHLEVVSAQLPEFTVPSLDVPREDRLGYNPKCYYHILMRFTKDLSDFLECVNAGELIHLLVPASELRRAGRDTSVRFAQVQAWLAEPTEGESPAKRWEQKLRSLPEMIDSFGHILA